MLKTTLQYIIRDHDRNEFELRKTSRRNKNDINSHFEDEPIEVEINDQYYNMGEKSNLTHT